MFRGGVTPVWQEAGATLSLKNAMAEYKLTEQELIEAKLECQWRTCYGNRRAQARARCLVARP